MGLRGSVLLVLLLVAGGAGGWAAAENGSAPVISSTAPDPVAAADPAVPYTPPEVTKDDPDIPALAEQLPTHDEQLGTRKAGGVVVPIPNGWARTNLADGRTATWRLPDGESGGYTVRVQLLSENRTLEQKVATRPIELEAQSELTDLEVLGSSLDTLKASFILSGYRRLTVIRWVSLDGDGLVDVEIAATGRLLDEDGLDSLVVTMAGDVRRLPPKRQKPGAATSPSTE